MTPIYPIDGDTACSPEWLHLNKLLSICTRNLPAQADADGSGRQAGMQEGAQRCKRKNCLFDAKRL